MSNVNKPAADQLPEWLVVTPEHAVVTLTKPSIVNGVQVDTITMRSPTLKESRDSNEAHPKDENAAEMMLFTSLCTAGKADLEGLSVKDYVRLQRGYFRLVTED